MQIAFHAGANCTDSERLLKSLQKNVDTLADRGIEVPAPGGYRPLLRKAIQVMGDEAPAPDARDALLGSILQQDETERLVMSQNTFLGLPNRVFEGGAFLPRAEFKIGALRRLFPEDELEIHVALRDPATFIPAAFAASRSASLDQFLADVDPMALSWTELLERLLAAAPDAQFVVWCNEDTPIIWAQLIRELAGLSPETHIRGGFDLLNAIMTPEGMRRFLAYAKTHPPRTESHKRRMIAAFLDKYALEEEVEQDIDLPGWTGDLIDDLSQNYEEDVEQIEAMERVRFIAP